MKLLAVAAPVVFLFVCVEAVLSLMAQWPYQFTGPGDPDRILQDFLYLGTLLSPPLPLLLALGAVSLLVRRDDRLGFLANLGMTLVLALMTVGSLGEALAASSPDVPRAVQIGGGIFNAVLFMSLLGISVAALRESTSSTQRGNPYRGSGKKRPRV